MLNTNTLEPRWLVHQVKNHAYAVPQEYLDGNRVRVPGFDSLDMFAGYSYLGLNRHPRINEAVTTVLASYGTGTHGVRMLAGTLQLHETLEKTIAAHVGTQSCLTFSSGYMANVSTITALVERADVVICDKLDHASILDGCQLSKARLVRYGHNNIEHLEKCLKKTASARRRLVIADSVFSMDGDIVDLPGIAALCKEHNAILMLDEAHALGVLGKDGGGAEDHFGMHGCVDVKTGSLSKAIPSVGGYVAGSQQLCEFLGQHARAFVYSSALPPPAAAAALAAFEVLRTEPERLERLRSNISYFADGLSAVGLPFQSHQTPIFPVVCGEDESALELADYCRQHGMHVQAIPYPIVPRGAARLRVSITAAHTRDQMDAFIDVLSQGLRELGMIDKVYDASFLCKA